MLPGGSLYGLGLLCRGRGVLLQRHSATFPEFWTIQEYGSRSCSTTRGPGSWQKTEALSLASGARCDPTLSGFSYTKASGNRSKMEVDSGDVSMGRREMLEKSLSEGIASACGSRAKLAGVSLGLVNGTSMSSRSTPTTPQSKASFCNGLDVSMRLLQGRVLFSSPSFHPSMTDLAGV